MNKKYVILILTTVFMLIPNIVKAEEVICEYSANKDQGILFLKETIYVNLEIVYDENSFSYKMDYSGTKIDYGKSFDLTYDEFMEKIKNNSGSAKCPYTLKGIIYGGSTMGAVSLPYTIGVVNDNATSNFTFACTNCDVDDIPIFEPGEYDDCEGILGPELISFINTIFDYVKVLVPVALIALGSFDIGRAVFAGNEDEMKKATKTFIRRLIIAVIIMFSPLLVNFIINVVNNATGTGYSGTCGIN